MVHVLKWLSMACSVVYVILAVSVLAVSISWKADGIKTGAIRLDYDQILVGLIALGCILAVVGITACLGSLNDSFWMTAVSTFVVLLTAIGFAVVSGSLTTQFGEAEWNLKNDMVLNIAKYSEDNNTTYTFWNNIQTTYNCCGIYTPNDWTIMSRFQVIPESCNSQSNSSVSDLPGCLDVSLRPARKAVKAGVYSTAIMSGLLGVGFLCNVMFCAVLRRTQDKEI